MSSSTRIAITGLGPLSSMGIGKDNLWKNINSGKANVKKEEAFIDGELWDSFFLHKVEGFNVHKFGIDEDRLSDIKDWKEGEEITDLNYLLAAVKLALDDAKLDYSKRDNGLGLVLAHENIGLMPFGLKVSNLAYNALIGKSKDQLSKKDFFNSLYKSFLKSGYDIQSFADLYHVAKVFNIHNYSLFLNNACASGLYAYEAAAEIIKSGQAKAVVVAASDNPEIYKYLWFRDLGIYSKSGKVRPFCKDSDGLVFGDGGAGVVLEDLASAKKRKAPIYAEYIGGGFDLEGWKITVPQIGNDSYQRAINKAFKNSKTKKTDIDLLVPHGVGSQPIDYYEAQAITDTFGNNPKKPLISVFKPFVGHNLGSSALLESLIMLLSLKNDTVLPALNYENPDPKFNIGLNKEKKQVRLKTAMKICCAFAGFNAAAVFRKVN